MPKILIAGDLHLHAWPAWASVDDSGLNSRLLDQLTVLAQIQKYCADHDVEALCFLGDLFHSRSKLDVEVIWSAIQAFEQLSRTVPTVMTLVGNHDQALRSGGIHSLDALRPNVLVVDTPRTVTLCEGVRAHCHPFTTETDAFCAWTKQLGQAELFLGHQGIDGATVGAYEVPLKAEVKVSDLPLDRVRYAFLGHYHAPQAIAENAFYAGSLLQLDMGERKEAKSFIVLDTDSWTFKRVPTIGPKFKLYESVSKFESDLKRKKCDVKRDFIRVHGPAPEIKKLCEEFPRIQGVAEAPVRAQAPRVQASIAASDRELLEAYITRANPALDKQKLLDMGLKILGDVTE